MSTYIMTGLRVAFLFSSRYNQLMAKIVLDTKKIGELLGRGTEEVIVREHLEAALKSGRQLRIKLGVDPTSPDLHLGHTVALNKLRQFQELGHQIVLIIGDYTARVGDPSGKSRTRPMLSEKEIAANAKTYLAQVGRILDVAKLEIHNNSEWFNDASWILAVTSKFTAQRIIERDDFTNRMKSGTEVFMHELLYPMMQAYDSIKITADVELGGTDQKFNMLTGRDLQRHMSLPEQDVITLPILRGTDGVQKMSKSLNNYIGISEAADVMFGKVMSIPDSLIDEYYTLCTPTVRNATDPREAKLELGKIIVDMYHGKGAGEKAQAEFIRVFSNKEKPSDIPQLHVGVATLTLIELLVKTKLAKSKSEARRLVEQGGVKIDDIKQNDADALIALDAKHLVQVGPKKFLYAIK